MAYEAVIMKDLQTVMAIGVAFGLAFLTVEEVFDKQADRLRSRIKQRLSSWRQRRVGDGGELARAKDRFELSYKKFIAAVQWLKLIGLIVAITTTVLLTISVFIGDFQIEVWLAFFIAALSISPALMLLGVGVYSIFMTSGVRSALKQSSCI